MVLELFGVKEEEKPAPKKKPVAKKTATKKNQLQKKLQLKRKQLQKNRYKHGRSRKL